MTVTPRSAPDTRTVPIEPAPAVRIGQLSAWYGRAQAVGSVSLDIEPRTVTAIIGPSGCGKSTLLRCLNRMHETTPGARVAGQVFLGGLDIYWPGVDPVASGSDAGPRMSWWRRTSGARLSGTR